MINKYLLVFCIISLSASNYVQAMSIPDKTLEDVKNKIIRTLAKRSSKLHEAVAQRNVEEVNQLVENNADVNQPGLNGVTPLELAAA